MQVRPGVRLAFVGRRMLSLTVDSTEIGLPSLSLSMSRKAAGVLDTGQSLRAATVQLNRSFGAATRPIGPLYPGSVLIPEFISSDPGRNYRR